MHDRFPTAYRRLAPIGRLVPVLFLAAAATWLACDQPGPTQADAELQAMKGGPPGGGSTGALQVTVLDNGGDPLEGYAVVAVNAALGPYVIGPDHGLAAGTTNASGLATVSELPAGDYCVHASPAPLLDDGIAPADVPDVQDLGSVMNGAKRGNGWLSVAFTKPNWVTYCVNDPQVGVRGGKTTEVELQIPDPPADLTTLEGQLAALGLDGGPSVWLVALIDLSILPQAWQDRLENRIGNGLFPALHFSADASSFLFHLEDLSSLILQSDFLDLGNGSGLQGLTLHLEEGGNLGTLSLEPQWCQIDEFTETDGDASGSVDFVEPVRAGFLVDPFTFEPLGGVGIQYGQQGGGPATLVLRERGSSTKTLQVDYTLGGGGDGCQEEASPSGGLAGRVVVDCLARDLGGAAWEVTWAVTDLRADAVEFGFKTAGDDGPDASRNPDGEQDVSSGLFALSKPAECSAYTGNDPRWIIGG